MIPTTHELKIYKEYADAVVKGKKTFELRLNDRHYTKGDKVRFYKVLDDNCIPMSHPITQKMYEITYILHGGAFTCLDSDWCIFSIKEIKNEDFGNNSL